MQAHDPSLSTRAFGEHANPELGVACQSHQDAMRFLTAALGKANGFALLQGPTGSGKSTIIKEQRAWSARDSYVALVEGNRLKPRRLLTSMLSQFGIQFDSDDDDQLLHKLNNFVTHETRFSRPPILIIDNADCAPPSTLRLLNWLAALEARGNYALRIVLTGNERLSSLPRRDGMRNLARRHPPIYTLNPLTEREMRIYLRTRLIASGCARIEEVFPMELCDQLREESKGWPGALNKHAIEHMESMAAAEPARPIPRVIVSREGEVVAEHQLTERQYVIGRSKIANIVIKDAYASKMHALLQLRDNALVLADLNSTNGTTVNSRIATITVLRSDDIIMLGRYRIKILDAPAISPEIEELVDAADTMKMKSLDELRLARAKRTITMLKHQQPQI